MARAPKYIQPDLLEGTEHAPKEPPVFRGHTFVPALDAARLENAQARVLRLMLDEKWHTIEELRSVGGSSGDRRARQLRDEKIGGFQVEVERAGNLTIDGSSGLWLYRIRPGSVTREQVSRFIQKVGGKGLLRGEQKGEEW